jgi:putrescine transport system substrate-binding protein
MKYLQKVRTFLLIIICNGLIGSAVHAQDKVLRIYNWSNYLGHSTIEDFTRETGIKVRLDFYDSNEMLHQKLSSGRSGYDIVLPSSNWAQLQMNAGFYQKLDKKLLPNLEHIDSSMRQVFSSFDPGNQYFVNWLWGYTSIAINTDKVQKALGSEPLPDNMWELLFNKKYASKLRSCGISLLDSSSELVSAALLSLGRDPFSRKASDYVDVENVLKDLRSHITMISSKDYIDDLARGGVCVAMGWSGDLNVAKQRALVGKTGQKIEVLYPKNGGILFFDMMAIPVDAPNPEHAHQFINYILRPKVHASLTNHLLYANANQKAKEYVDAGILQNSRIYLHSHELLKMQTPKLVNNDLRRKINVIFANFKSGL